MLNGSDLPVTHATNHLFDGARADLSKALSFNPAFQVTHSFNLASYTQPATYNFGAVFANGDVSNSDEFLLSS